MESTRSIVARDDTLLGICFAIGQDFGFNPRYLRILFAVVVLWSLPVAVGAYAALGALVALSRWLAPEPAPVEQAAAEPVVEAEEPCDPLPLAA